MAVFYFREKGLYYDIDDTTSREKARTNFGHTKIDKEILSRAIELYLEYLNSKFIEFLSE